MKNGISEELDQAEKLIKATKKELYTVIDSLYHAGYFKVSNKRARGATKYKWKSDERRKFLDYPMFILLRALKVMVENKDNLYSKGRLLSGKEPRARFSAECNKQVMDEVDRLIAIKNMESTKQLKKWRPIVKDLGLLLTVDKIDKELQLVVITSY